MLELCGKRVAVPCDYNTGKEVFEFTKQELFRFESAIHFHLVQLPKQLQDHWLRVDPPEEFKAIDLGYHWVEPNNIFIDYDKLVFFEWAYGNKRMSCCVGPYPISKADNFIIAIKRDKNGEVIWIEEDLKLIRPLTLDEFRIAWDWTFGKENPNGS